MATDPIPYDPNPIVVPPPPLSRTRRLGLAIFGILVIALGAPMILGGIWLAGLGGSWYYLLAGGGLLACGVLLFRGRLAGAWVFSAVLAGTLAWTIWERGTDYWGYVPRLALLLALAVFLPLLIAGTQRPGPRRVLRALSLLPLLALIVGFALAFVPHDVRRGAAAPARLQSSMSASSAGSGPFVQPANAPATGDWTAYGGSNAATRYSPLARITTRNVGDLTRAWVTRTGDMPRNDLKKWAAETTPLKVGDTLYLCTATNDVLALDAATGAVRWRFNAGVKTDWIPYSATCRGVAYHEAPELPTDAPCKRRVIEGTLDARLIALDAADGKPCADFNGSGEVSLLTGMGEVHPGMVAVTSPPTIIRGVAVVNHQVLDGQRRDAPSGVIRGYDAVTGELRWAWDMHRPDRRGLPPEGDTYSRGTPNSWTIAAGDEALGLVYLPMGNSAADYYNGSRTEIENRYSTAIVALDVMTGEVRWSFQTVRKDVWDYDMGSQPSLVDLPLGAGRVPALVVPTKQGDLYLLNRATGEPLTRVEDRPALPGNVQGNELSPTQPHSVDMPALRKPDLTERDMWGLTPLDQLHCRIKFRRANYTGLYTPPSLDRPWIQWPGYNGGNDWGSVAVDTDRGILVANYNNTPMYDQLMTREDADEEGLAALGMPGGSSEPGGAVPQIGTPYAAKISPFRLKWTGLLCNEPPYGSITAIDLMSRQVIWDVPLGTGRLNGPWGIPTHLPIPIGTPNNGGPVVTAGGVIFIGAATDGLFRAIDIESGETLWSDELEAGGQSTPLTYEVNGEQYVLIVAGGHHFMETEPGDYVIAYKLAR
jgi:quinoprotein glucose dehydrogenase